MPALPHHPLISLIIPHHKGGGGCHIYRGLSPSPKHTHTISSCISTFFLSWIVFFLNFISVLVTEQMQHVLNDSEMFSLGQLM